jgi:predicted transcriptional regulator
MANNNPQKLTDELVRKIRYLLLAGINQRHIAHQTRVSQATICQIHTGKIWKNKANI